MDKTIQNNKKPNLILFALSPILWRFLWFKIKRAIQLGSITKGLVRINTSLSKSISCLMTETDKYAAINPTICPNTAPKRKYRFAKFRYLMINIIGKRLQINQTSTTKYMTNGSIFMSSSLIYPPLKSLQIIFSAFVVALAQ